ncbi:hypothetical protein MRBLMI12_000425 [Microbacterium sp. LMI12-1-1.1]|uniref:DNA sulfur modification protein DndB n=1 Tax=Microbacterium sp. LMI12-1-1.1 TaxID=3135225 RepID=UPI003430291F
MSAIKESVAPATLASYTTDKELFASRYKQGGRTVYNVAMTPAQIASVIKRPNPDADNPGNRRIRPDHAQAFARYFIDHDEWVVPGIILRAPNIFTFVEDFEVPDAQFGTVKYQERNQGDIHILDGQHRILGFHIALEQIDELIDRARSAKATARRVQDPVAAKEAEKEIHRLEKVRDRLYKERVSVEIQVTDDLQAYRQMFFDIAENALGITASVKARFDSRKVVNRALPAALEHPLLAGRTDLEVDRIPRKSPNLLTARHVMETMRVLTVGFDGRVSRRQDKELDEVQIAQESNAFFTALTEAFPQLKAVELGQLLPDTLRETSMLGSPLFLRVLAGVWYELVNNHGFTRPMATEFLGKLAKHVNAPAHADSIWKLHVDAGAFNEGAWGPNGRRQDAKGLVETIVDWAIMREAFVDEEPLPEPEPVVDEDEGIDYALGHDTTPIEIELRNEVDEIAAASKERAKAIAKG